MYDDLPFKAMKQEAERALESIGKPDCVSMHTQNFMAKDNLIPKELSQTEDPQLMSEREDNTPYAVSVFVNLPN